MTTPVNKVSGIGPKTTEYLKGQGITTAEALLKYGVEKLASAPGFSPGRAETVISETNKLLGGAQKQTTVSATKSSGKAITKPGKKDKKDKKQKKNKDKKSKNKKGKNKKGKKDKKDKKKNKK